MMGIMAIGNGELETRPGDVLPLRFVSVAGLRMSDKEPEKIVEKPARGFRRLHLRAVRGEKELDSVGAELRAARLKKGDELEAVATKLKIRKETLQALEESEYDRHPPKVYAIGFVRAYARYLGLDAEAMVRRYKTEIAGRSSDKAPQLNFPEAPEENAFPLVTMALVAAVIGLLGYGAWNLSQPVDQTSAAQVVTEDEAKRLADEAARNQPGPLGLPADPLLFAQQMAAPEAAPPKVYGDVEGVTRITLRAAEDCYVRIRDVWSEAGPKVIFEQTLLKGESYKVPNRGGLWLRAGNAGGLIVEIDGQAIGPLGRPGDTADRVSLTATKLLARLQGGPETQRETAQSEPAPGSSPPPKPNSSTQLAPASSMSPVND
jgi:cytoskeleton protein RodZ